MNAIASLSPPPGARGDVMRFSQRLRETPLLGRYRPIDVAIARGEIEPVDPAAPRPDLKAIENAFTAAKLEDLQALASAAAAAKEQLEALDQFLTAQVGDGSPNLQAFKAALGDVNTLLQRHVSRRTGQPAGDDGAAAATGGNGDSGVHQTGRPMSGDIRSSSDVVDLLDKICRYYEDNEKSSPVPLFLRAARRMVSKNYLDIFDTLTADAVQQLRAISTAEEKPAE
jgi:type VI secretion system protein ImpA